MDHEDVLPMLHELHIAPPSLESLGSDILFLIMEQLYLDRLTIPQSSCPLERLRLVSRRLETAATPFRFRSIVLTDQYMHKGSRRWEKVLLHTRNLIFDRSLNWKLAAELLASCTHIESIEWSWWDTANYLPIPKAISDVIRSTWSSSELHILNYPWIYTSQAELITNSIPLTNIVAISTGTSNTGCDTEPLRRLAVALPNLRSLELTSMEQKFSPVGPRMPPIKHLSMSNCLWTYNTEEMHKIWDFSRLESLIIDVSFHFNLDLFRCLSPDSLPCLKKIKAIQRLPRGSDDGLTAKYHHFISEAGVNMREIDLVCDLMLFDIRSLRGNWQELRVLRIHDSSKFARYREIWPTLPFDELERLNIACPRLKELSLDMDTRKCDKFHFMRIIAEFRNLRKFAVQIEADLWDFVGDLKADASLGPTPELVIYLRDQKLGLKMEEFTVHTGTWGVDASSRTYSL